MESKQYHVVNFELYFFQKIRVSERWQKHSRPQSRKMSPTFWEPLKPIVSSVVLEYAWQTIFCSRSLPQAAKIWKSTSDISHVRRKRYYAQAFAPPEENQDDLGATIKIHFSKINLLCQFLLNMLGILAILMMFDSVSVFTISV